MNSRTPTTKALRRAQDLYADSRELARNGAFRAKSFIHQRPVLSAPGSRPSGGLATDFRYTR